MGNKQGAGQLAVTVDVEDVQQYEHRDRPHPQVTFRETVIDEDSFFGKLRRLYAETVLKTQLEQLKKQGSYSSFDLQWQDIYDVRRLIGAKCRTDGIPPSLFWGSDVGKWIEAVCYFLASPDGKSSLHAVEFEKCLSELVNSIERAQEKDGYLNIYFQIVDPKGRFQNLRDMHEMYNAGHLLEAALAHYHYTHSRQFLDIMIRNIECFMRHFGPGKDQLHGYPGHPELELAVLRLYDVTKDQRHLAFGHYLLAARGVKRADQDNETYFVAEARTRGDAIIPHTLENLHDGTYNQSHLPLHEQEDILGHSVRALYLTTAAADLGGPFLDDAKRLLFDAIDHKMYITGGLGTEPRTEGFSRNPYYLPQSTNEGGCYAETCASIACMMTCERVLSHGLVSKARDAMEVCLYNNVIGGGSLDGTKFAYDQKLATYGDETAERHEWFEVCCCPPNLSRTLGMLGGYTWKSEVDVAKKTIHLDVYLLISASRTVALPSGGEAKVAMKSEMPWQGSTTWDLTAPEGWTWQINFPTPDYAENINVSRKFTTSQDGFGTVTVDASASLSMTFEMPARLMAPHPLTGRDTLSVMRGPISYLAESIDNPLESSYPHFENIGLRSSTTVTEVAMQIGGLEVVALKMDQPVLAIQQPDEGKAYRAVTPQSPARTWKQLDDKLLFTPWFSRANRGGNGHVRTAFLRAD